MEQKPSREDLKRQRDEALSQAMASFPYEKIEIAGEQALAAWEIIRATRPGSSAVIVGEEDQFIRIVEGGVQWPGGPSLPTAEQILDAASRLRHPDDLTAKHAADLVWARERAMQRLRDKPDLRIPPEMLAASVLESGPELGEWPSEPMGAPQLSVAIDTLTGLPLTKVQLVILPTEDWTTIPAYLHWGNWNSCPAPAYHVAALRSWRDRFGAELIGLGHDVMNIRVSRRPATREAALDLAREQSVYCSDIVDQGVGTLSALAAVLMESDWWYFWWD